MNWLHTRLVIAVLFQVLKHVHIKSYFNLTAVWGVL